MNGFSFAQEEETAEAAADDDDDDASFDDVSTTDLAADSAVGEDLVDRIDE
jgi:hypothetical protein